MSGLPVKTGVRAPARIDTKPTFGLFKVACQGWRCTEQACWNLWRSFYCTDHMIRTGFLAGPVRMPGTQLGLVP